MDNQTPDKQVPSSHGSAAVTPDLMEVKRILQGACDRTWEDEDLYQTAVIASNAIYWRDREIENLRHDLSKALANHSADLSARTERLSEEVVRLARERLRGGAQYSAWSKQTTNKICEEIVRVYGNSDSYVVDKS